jgi:hypothetical protein
MASADTPALACEEIVLEHVCVTVAMPQPVVHCSQNVLVGHFVMVVGCT